MFGVTGFGTSEGEEIWGLSLRGFRLPDIEFPGWGHLGFELWEIWSFWAVFRVPPAEGNGVFRVSGDVSIGGFSVYLGEETWGPSMLRGLGASQEEMHLGSWAGIRRPRAKGFVQQGPHFPVSVPALLLRCPPWPSALSEPLALPALRRSEGARG